jgi:hypothetical protein
MTDLAKATNVPNLQATETNTEARYGITAQDDQPAT